MKKVWINPAFKDVVKPSIKPEVKKEEKPVIKEQVEAKIEKKKKEKKPKSAASSKPVVKENTEHKLFNYFMEKQMPLEIKVLTGATFTGKIKWFSDWLMALEVDNKPGLVVLNRLMIICYYQLKDNSLSEKDIKQLPSVDISGVEINMLQKYKDNKTPLIFHLQGGLEIKGTMEWYEKVVYHIRSLDDKTDHTMHRVSVLYFEEAI